MNFIKKLIIRFKIWILGLFQSKLDKDVKLVTPDVPPWDETELINKHRELARKVVLGEATTEEVQQLELVRKELDVIEIADNRHYSSGVLYLKCVTLKCPIESWDDIEGLTVGKIYIITGMESHPKWAFTQLSVINDKGEEMRALGGHFEYPIKI